ncbi:MAG: glycogen-binding domain-containing protein [Spirochaetales bacterium]|nr:glycogen-binding domain-containing protein [Spirochaetales bacterium]
MKFLISFIICVAACVSPITSQESYPVQLHLKLLGLKEPAAPERFEDKAIFSYKPPRPVRFTGAVFSHENYEVLHSFQRNSHGIYFLVLLIPREAESIKYRIVTDGLWMTDPMNPDTIRDNQGIKLSRYILPEKSEAPLESPGFSRDGIVTFRYRGSRESFVSLAGSFNNWDPFLHPMEWNSAGYFEITLRLPPGVYSYQFVDNGICIPDPKNPRKLVTRENVFVSPLEVPVTVREG